MRSERGILSQQPHYFKVRVLNNLVVNYEAGCGKQGIEVTKYIVSRGGDATVVRNGNEDWLVVFNPKIIKYYRKVDTKEKIEFELPRIS